MFGVDYSQLDCLQGMRFLVVDDEAVNINFFVNFFEDLELELDVARDGREAVDRVLSHPPEHYAAVLMDIRMPRLKGTEATRAIRSHPEWRRLPIIAMSGNTQPEDRDHYHECGMVDLIPKPTDLQTIFQTLVTWTDPARSIGVTEQDHRPPPASGFPVETEPSTLEALRQRQQQLMLERPVFQRLLHVFLDSHGTSMAGLRQALASDDPAQASHWAHKLAGSCGNIGAMTLRTGFKSLEAQCDRGAGRGQLARELKDTEEGLIRLIKAIEAFNDE